MKKFKDFKNLTIEDYKKAITKYFYDTKTATWDQENPSSWNKTSKVGTDDVVIRFINKHTKDEIEIHSIDGKIVSINHKLPKTTPIKTRKIIGLSVWEIALKKMSKQDIIEKAIKISKQFPDIWGGSWSNFDWALGNAVREVAYPNSTKDIGMTWNADDVLTSEDLDYIKISLNIKTNYTQTFK